MSVKKKTKTGETPCLPKQKQNKSLKETLAAVAMIPPAAAEVWAWAHFPLSLSLGAALT
jgi:hypothetical protein